MKNVVQFLHTSHFNSPSFAGSNRTKTALKLQFRACHGAMEPWGHGPLGPGGIPQVSMNKTSEQGSKEYFGLNAYKP